MFQPPRHISFSCLILDSEFINGHTCGTKCGSPLVEMIELCTKLDAKRPLPTYNLNTEFRCYAKQTNENRI